jgi:hypothetical protein
MKSIPERWWRNGVFALAFTAAGMLAMAAGTFQLEHAGVGSGGGTSSGGDFVVTGQIGVLGTGQSTGGSFTLEGGSLAMFMVVQTAGAPMLTLTRVGNDVVISWPVTAIGFELEQTGNLSAPSWSGLGMSPTVVGDHFQMTLPATGSSKFFRLQSGPN